MVILILFVKTLPSVSSGVEVCKILVVLQSPSLLLVVPVCTISNISIALMSILSKQETKNKNIMPSINFYIMLKCINNIIVCNTIIFLLLGISFCKMSNVSTPSMSILKQETKKRNYYNSSSIKLYNMLKCINFMRVDNEIIFLPLAVLFLMSLSLIKDAINSSLFTGGLSSNSVL